LKKRMRRRNILRAARVDRIHRSRRHHSISAGLNQLMGLLQGAEVTPTTQLVAAAGQRRTALTKLMAQWNALKSEAHAQNLGIE
jgi:hypothetical protein